MRWETYFVVLACLPGILASNWKVPGCGYTDWMDRYITAGMDARLRFHQNLTFLAQYSVLPSDYRWIRFANGTQLILSIANGRYFVENAVLKITDVTPADEGAYLVECWNTDGDSTYYRTPKVQLKLAQATTTTASPIVRTTAPTGSTFGGEAATDDGNRNTIIAILVGAVFIAMVSVAAIIVTTRRAARKRTTDTQPFARSIRKEHEKSDEPACNVADDETIDEPIMDDYAEIGAVQTSLKITINKHSRRYKQCEIAGMFDADDATVLSNSNTCKDTLVHSDNKTVDADNTIEIYNDYSTIQTDLARGGACGNTTDDTASNNDHLVGSIDGNEYAVAIPKSKRGSANADAPINAFSTSIVGPIDGNQYATTINKSNAKGNNNTYASKSDAHGVMIHKPTVGPINGNEYASAIPKRDSNTHVYNNEEQPIGLDTSIVGPIGGNEYATAIPKSSRRTDGKKAGDTHQAPAGVEYANTDKRKGSQELKYVELDQEWLRRSRESLDELDETVNNDDFTVDNAQPMEYVSIDFNKKAFVAPKRAAPSIRKPTASLKELKRK